MKKIFLSASMLVMLASCDEPNIKFKPTKYKVGFVQGKDLVEIKLEGCEYFFYDKNDLLLCHKGNCSNPIHTEKKEK